MEFLERVPSQKQRILKGIQNALNIKTTTTINK